MKQLCSWPSRTVRCGALVVLVWIVPAAGLSLQQQPPRKIERITGKIQKLDQETKTISLVLRSKLVRPVVYTGTTTFAYRKKTATVDDVRNGRKLTCLGNLTKGLFHADSCTIND